MENAVHEGAVQGEGVLPQFGRYACISEADKEIVTVHRREGQGKAISPKKTKVAAPCTCFREVMNSVRVKAVSKG